MPRAVIFDLYGTLLRLARPPSVHLKLLRRAGVEDLAAAINRSMSSDHATLSDFCEDIGLPEPHDIEQLNEELHREVSAVTLFSEVTETLLALSDRGIRLGLISNLASAYKTPVFTLGLSELFDVAVFSCDHGILKPNPQIYEITLDQLGVSASETLMVGDSVKCDVAGPAAVGINGIHLARNAESIASVAIGTLDEILEHLA